MPRPRKKPALVATLPLIAAVAFVVFCLAELLGQPAGLLPQPTELHANNHMLSLTLHAAVTPQGKDSFYFNGQPDAPTLRTAPGDQLKITYINDLPTNPQESCLATPCMDMTNLHFHGLAISPDAPQDDVLTMMAAPGKTLHYTVQIPKDHPPGLYWYHTHPHGESYRQALDGMSGALVIEGMASYFPALIGMRERVLVVRGRSLKKNPESADLTHRVDLGSEACGGEHEAPDEVMTVNGAVRPEIAISHGERQFWRIANASADRYLDLELEGESFEIVAMDGEPIALHDPAHPTRVANRVLLPPAGRLEAIVTGPAGGSGRRLITHCVDTGPAGDPNPAMVLADIALRSWAVPAGKISRPPVAPAFSAVDLAAEKKAPPRFTVTFTEDKNGFYINGETFAPDSAPMVRAKVGSYQHWKIINDTRELHPMHIHQVHFLAYAENDRAIADPVWLDTVNVPYGGSVDVIMDFTDPVIRGMSVFHCHLLNHEDKGMMAKILFE